MNTSSSNHQESRCIGDLVTMITPWHGAKMLSVEQARINVLVYDNTSKSIDISFGKLITINKSIIDAHPDYFLKPLDIVLTVAGSHIGLVSILPIEIPAMTFMLNLSCVAFRVKNDSVDPHVLFCYLRSEDAQAKLKSIIRGSSAARISNGDLIQLKITL